MGALPHDLQRGEVVVRDRPLDRARDVGECLLPAPAQLDVVIGARDPAARAGLLVDHVVGQARPEASPVRLVECLHDIGTNPGAVALLGLHTILQWVRGAPFVVTQRRRSGSSPGTTRATLGRGPGSVKRALDAHPGGGDVPLVSRSRPS